MTMERIFSGLMTLVCLGLLYTAWGFTADIAYDPIGPCPYPMLIFGLLAIGTFVIAVRPATFAKTIELGWTPVIIRNLLLCTIALLLYGVFFDMLGFIVSTTLMSIAVGLLFSGNIIKSIVFSVLLSIALYVLFDVLLEVNLPLGVLSGLRG